MSAASPTSYIRKPTGRGVPVASLPEVKKMFNSKSPSFGLWAHDEDGSYRNNPQGMLTVIPLSEEREAILARVIAGCATTRFGAGVQELSSTLSASRTIRAMVDEGLLHYASTAAGEPGVRIGYRA